MCIVLVKEVSRTGARHGAENRTSAHASIKNISHCRLDFSSRDGGLGLASRNSEIQIAILEICIGCRVGMKERGVVVLNRIRVDLETAGKRGAAESEG